MDNLILTLPCFAPVIALLLCYGIEKWSQK